MRHILIIGAGSREASIVEAAKQHRAKGRGVKLISVLGSNGAFDADPSITKIHFKKVSEVVEWAKSKKVTLVYVGSENDIARGFTEALTIEGIPVCAPTQGAFNNTEAWKHRMKRVADMGGIGTAPYEIARSLEEAMAIATSRLGDGDIDRDVCKFSGLASGKGVNDNVRSEEDARRFLRAIYEDNIFGKPPAGESHTVVFEDFLGGPLMSEYSVHAVARHEDFVLLPTSRDRKKNDRGEMTGGMGCYMPVPGCGKAFQNYVTVAFVAPYLHILAQVLSTPFVGILYPGLIGNVVECMLWLLEVNCRGGGPELELHALWLQDVLIDLINWAAVGGQKPQIPKLEEAVVCFVAASQEYPKKGHEPVLITGLEAANEVEGVQINHGGTVFHDGKYYTQKDGSRILTVNVKAPNVAEARERGLYVLGRIKFGDEAPQFVRSIGEEAVSSE